jgi:hypothetical protein
LQIPPSPLDEKYSIPQLLYLQGIGAFCISSFIDNKKISQVNGDISEEKRIIL